MTRIGAFLPGESDPGREMPGMSEPGARAPGEQVEETATVTVAVDATGTTDIGSVAADRITVERVLVNGEVYGFDFQVTVEGTALFSAAQSPESTNEEEFIPDNDVVVVANDAQASATVEITSASTSDGSTADITLVASVEDE